MEYYRDTDDVRMSFSSRSAFVCVHDSVCLWRRTNVKQNVEVSGGYPRLCSPLGSCRKFNKQSRIMWDDKRWYLNLKRTTTTWAAQGGSVSLNVMNSTRLRATWYFRVFSTDLSCWDEDQRQTDWGVEWNWSAAHITRQGEICPCVCFVACFVSECVNRAGLC